MSDHWAGAAMDWKVPVGSTPEDGARRAGMYAGLLGRTYAKPVQAMTIDRYGGSYSLTIEPIPRPVVLWGVRSLPAWAYLIPRLGWWLARRFPEPVQLGSPDDLEQARRARERAAFGRAANRWGLFAHASHVHVGASTSKVRVGRAGYRRLAQHEAAPITQAMDSMGDMFEEVWRDG